MKHINVKVDTKNIRPKLENAVKQSRHIVGQQILKDANYFIPFDTGNLRSSSLRSSDFDEGKLVWDTPYARKLYFGLRYKFSKDSNPHASALWFERANMLYSSQWMAMADKAVKQFL